MKKSGRGGVTLMEAQWDNNEVNNEVNIKDVEINQLINEYRGLIVKSISSITGRYVSVENDDEYSIGLMAFVEAVDRYEPHRGAFSSFAKLVICSRVKNHLLKEGLEQKVEYIEELKDRGINIDGVKVTEIEDSGVLTREIESLGRELQLFGFTFEDLVEEAPKHEDTRRRAISISEKINEEAMLKNFMYEKRRLPIKQISTRFSITEKIIKGSKKFIISVVVILDKNLRNLKLWIRR